MLAPRQTDLYENPAFVDYVANLRNRPKPLTWKRIHALLVRDFAYAPKVTALLKWWTTEGQKCSQGLDYNLNPKDRGEELRKFAKTFSRKLTGWLQLSGDFMISSDWHLPHFNPEMAERYFRIAKKFKIRQHVIIGDFVNLDAMSAWDQVDLEDSWENERAAASYVLAQFERAFDTTYWLMGNHEVRYMRKLAFQVDLNDFASQLLDRAKVGKSLVCSTYAYAIINGEWRVTHPKTYSRHGGTVPYELTAKYEQSVIGAHGHHVGIRVGRNNRRVGIDIGGMFDVERIGYVMREDSAHPMWNCAFGMLRNNAAYVFSESPLLTDWDFWLPKRRNGK